MGVDKPNYTQIPNLLLDDLLMLMSDAEMKVTLAIARRTFGYHRDTIEISISQLQTITHLSKQGVVNGINAGMERGTITRSVGKRGGFVYELVINGEHPSTCQPSGHVNQVDSQRSRQVPVNQVDTTCQPSGQVPVNQVDQNTPVLKKVLKKERKKVLKKGDAAPQHPAIAIFHEVWNRKPNKPQTKTICERITDFDLWREACQAWGVKGHRPTNVEGMIDWYEHPERFQTSFRPPGGGDYAAGRSTNNGVNAVMDYIKAKESRNE